MRNSKVEKVHFLEQDLEASRTKSTARGSSNRIVRKLLLYLCIVATLNAAFRAHIQVLSIWQSNEHARQSNNPDFAKIQHCTIKNLHKDLSFLDNAEAISDLEFISRRDRLAIALDQEGMNAFVVEPGYTSQYYFNISQLDWEPWEPEERPFLMIIQPIAHHKDGSITAKTTYLAPHFEEDRVRQLGIPSDGELDIFTWEEHWDPYAILFDKILDNRQDSNVVVDEEMREYIVHGIESVGLVHIGMSEVANVAAVREQKSPAELELLRAVNTATVAAVRAMRPCLQSGLSENEVIAILDNALLSMPGFSLFFNIVLFDENAALPHGGKATGDKTLAHDTVVLIDVGAHYRGYSSDICRTFLIGDPPAEDETADDRNLTSKQHVFHTVLSAQTASMSKFRSGNTAASVDIAARDAISQHSPAGTDWGTYEFFTHRVGHGIGIKAHESPYLNKGNVQTILKENMTFTSEPGVYLPGQFGVRTEDIFVVTDVEKGEVRCLSGPRARDLWTP